MVKKNFIAMLCWLKLNGKPKWNLFIAKTAAQANKEETGDPTDPTQEPLKKVRRFLRGEKWEQERAKRDGAIIKLAERFEDILSKKEERCVKRSNLKEEKKAKMFKLFFFANTQSFRIISLIGEREEL